mmetsp:Transcript_13793/g.37382  ORF Transcript_13793/g.37382 Transcript_13793/m.37382 type:complete len:214 (-) Transcript_13793:826-1467(-)
MPTTSSAKLTIPASLSDASPESASVPPEKYNLGKSGKDAMIATSCWSCLMLWCGLNCNFSSNSPDTGKNTKMVNGGTCMSAISFLLRSRSSLASRFRSSSACDFAAASALVFCTNSWMSATDTVGVTAPATRSFLCPWRRSVNALASSGSLCDTNNLMSNLARSASVNISTDKETLRAMLSKGLLKTELRKVVRNTRHLFTSAGLRAAARRAP